MEKSIADLFQRALFFASEKHSETNQKVQGTDLPYMTHVVNVAMEVFIASNQTPGFDLSLAIPVALLHDTLEDTNGTIEEIQLYFGDDVYNGVLALTKNEALPKEEQISDSLTRIKKLKKEIWAVKLADRISNLRRPPDDWNEDKKEKYLEDAKMIFAELQNGNKYLAERLKDKIESYQVYTKLVHRNL